MANDNIDYSPAPVDPNEDPEIAAVQAAAAEADAIVAKNNQTIDDQDPFEAARQQAEAAYNAEEPQAYDAKDLGIEEDSWLSQKFGDVKAYLNRQTLTDELKLAAGNQNAATQQAQNQATLAARYKQPATNDWRVRLVLSENADYLYKAGAAESGDDILRPLRDANGVIFPYTPSISTSYQANYEKYDLVHSNYRGYFYKNSAVNDINITATFTAQDTTEAQYLLAVIHFFRSVTKMFYGKDQQRGAPPPMVYLVGLGQYQFSGHPCLVSNFQYNLPADVDYIRANSPNNYGTNLLNRVNNTSQTSNPIASVVNRLLSSNLVQGALPPNPFSGVVGGATTNLTQSTYVPTKMEIAITLLPVQTRAQVSQQFSLKNFSNGNLLKGGFW